MQSLIRNNVEDKQEELVFPVLMESISNPGRVVLFLDAGKGVLVAESVNSLHYAVGYLATDWLPATEKSIWKKLTGMIELSN